MKPKFERVKYLDVVLLLLLFIAAAGLVTAGVMSSMAREKNSKKLDLPYNPSESTE